jgi:hypothetical protein
MATEQKISELPAAAALSGADVIVVNQSGVTEQSTINAVKTFVLTSLGATGTFTTADVPAKTVTVVNGVITAIV